MPPNGLIKPGNIDLNPRSAARHVRLETDQGVFLVPAVGDDGKELSRQEAIERFAGNQYKVELARDIPEGEPITLYTIGEFTDLCRGGHARCPTPQTCST